MWVDLMNVSQNMCGVGGLPNSLNGSGDFNDISHPSEKKGGLPNSLRSV